MTKLRFHEDLFLAIPIINNQDCKDATCSVPKIERAPAQRVLFTKQRRLSFSEQRRGPSWLVRTAQAILAELGV